MTVTLYARRPVFDTDHSTSNVERRNVPKDRRSGRDRRQVYDADYFALGGIERRRGSWDKRSGKYRRFVLDLD